MLGFYRTSCSSSKLRYTGLPFLQLQVFVYHVAISVLFIPLVAATLGRKKEINEIWYGYWAEASILAMFAGIFDMVSSNYLIHKTMERSAPQLRQEVKNIKTATEMVSITRKLVGIARNLLPTIVLQNRFSSFIIK